MIDPGPLLHKFEETPVVGLLLRAYRESRRDGIKDMAASVAFFSFFSLFPLILGVVALGGFFLDPEELRDWLDKVLTDSIPVSGRFVAENIDALFRLRSAAGIVSIVGLIWSASKMAAAISRGLNRALGFRREYAFYWSPLRNFAMTLFIPILLLISFAFSTIVGVIDLFDLGMINDEATSWMSAGDGRISSLVIGFLVLTLIYKFVPYHRPTLSQVVPGAVTATVLLEAGKIVFVVFVDYSDRFEAVYGPLSSIIVLMLWLYVSAGVILYGGEIVGLRHRAAAENTE